MLAALAASGLAPPSSRFALPELSSRPSAAEASGAASSSASATVNRRRSLRLSAKKTSTSASDSAVEPPHSASTAGGVEGSSAPTASDVAESEAPEPAPSETVVNDDEFAADFTDDEVDVDAEVTSYPEAVRTILKQDP